MWITVTWRGLITRRGFISSRMGGCGTGRNIIVFICMSGMRYNFRQEQSNNHYGPQIPLSTGGNIECIMGMVGYPPPPERSISTPFPWTSVLESPPLVTSSGEHWDLFKLVHLGPPRVTSGGDN